jgi:membrane fusion protein, multidrug efflux system
MEPLLSHGYVSAEDVDRARTAQRATQAELSTARLQAQQAAAAVSGVDALVAQRAVVMAEIASAELNLEYATVRAPFDGRIVSLKTSTGQFASALKPVFTLIDTRHWYVVANFRETELKGVRAGTPATVYLMSDTGQRFQGAVDSISYGVSPDEGGLALPGGLPRIQRTLNWVHVAQRFPVKIRVDHPNPELFRVGTSAVAVLEPGRGNDGERH